MKILVIGKNSFLSANFTKYLKEKNISFRSIDYNKFHKLDINDYSIIINFSTNKDFYNERYSYKNDFDLHISERIKNTDIKLILFSTSKIYKSNFNIKEKSKKLPVGNYAKNKYISEKKVTKILKNYIIFRTANIFGRRLAKSKRGITYTFIDQFFSNIKKKKNYSS